MTSVYRDGIEIVLSSCSCGGMTFRRYLDRATKRTRTVCPRCVKPRASEQLIETLECQPTPGDRPR